MPNAQLPTNIGVIYDSNTLSVGMIVVPEYEGQLEVAFARTFQSVPNAVLVKVPVLAIQAVGFIAALSQIAPQVTVPGGAAANPVVVGALDKIGVAA